MFLCIFLWQTCVTCTFPWMRRFSVCSVKTPTFFFSSYKTNRLNEGSNVISQKRRGNQQKKIYTEQCFWNEVHMPYFSYFWAHRKTTKNWRQFLPRALQIDLCIFCFWLLNYLIPWWIYSKEKKGCSCQSCKTGWIRLFWN